MGRVEVFINPLYVLLFWVCALVVFALVTWLAVKFMKKKVEVEDLKGLIIVISSFVVLNVTFVVYVLYVHLFMLFINNIVKLGYLEFLHK